MSKISFPLRLVESFNPETGIWGGHRGHGNVVGKGMVRFGQNALVDAQVIVNGNTDQKVLITGYLCEIAIKLMLSRLESDISLRDVMQGLADRELAIDFMDGHECLLDLDVEADVCSVACDVVLPLGFSQANSPSGLSALNSDDQQGFITLLMLGHLYLLLNYLGCSQRQAMSKVLDFYASFSQTERAYLHGVLEGPILDSGNLLSLFLKRAVFDSPSPTEKPSQAIWRDQQITWLLGQDRIDLPYPRQTAIDILHEVADIDEQRSQLYRMLRSYDRKLERQNIERISNEVLEARQQLVFGRMSRAFHNQATLFADAVLLQPALSWRELATELSSLTEDAPNLQPSAGLLHLLLNSLTEVSLIHLEGACERFEEAVLDEQNKALSNALALSRTRLENFNDALAGQSIPVASHELIMTLTGKRLGLIERMRQEFLHASKRHAAYVVISQRPSPTGSHLLIKINEFEEPYPGKADNLRKLVRLAGDHIYSSPDYGWLEVADHWIEAIPLFIKEEVLVRDGQETTRTIIDIAGMEASFREEMADLWARNLRHVHDSELLGLARECMAATEFPGLDEEGQRQCQSQKTDANEIAALAVLFGEIYRQQVDHIQKVVEAEEVSPFEAMQQILLNNVLFLQVKEHQRITASWTESVRQLLLGHGINRDFAPELVRLRKHALQPRRALPTLHILTTQSAGMTEGYIRTWLEESMALFNIAEDLGLHKEIAVREEFFSVRILSLGEKVIRELGIWIEVEEMVAHEQISQNAAVLRLINRNRVVQEELSCLGTLLEFEEMKQGRGRAEACDDPNAVEEYVVQHAQALQEAALAKVIERNGEALNRKMIEEHRNHSGQDPEEALRHFVLEDEYYREDLQAYTRFSARHKVLEAFNVEHPELCLKECCEKYLRRYLQLGKTNARKQVIAERGLNHLSLHPLYYFKASGGGKRYHLIYTPSRVDLGKRERESVETWSQWVGGADCAAAQAGRQVYSLINKDVRVFESLTEPEILKTGENASMVSHFGFSNALSLMVTASRHGDFEAMADLMNKRRDRLIHPAGEGYGGYCVPKDGLFLEFVLTLNRAEKLRQIGVPEAHHLTVIALANLLLDRRPEFPSQLEWEGWAAEQLQRQDCLNPFFTVSRGLPVFQVTRIAHVLENLGQPELRDPYRVASSLAAGWGLHKMVTGGEQVNRFMPFFKSWLIRQGIAEAARRHPQLPIAIENCVLVLTVEYKPDTQDARFAVGLRKFEILTGTSDHLLNALDLQGQAVVVLMNQGFAELQRRGWVGRLGGIMHVNPNDQATVEQMQKLFPPCERPAEIRMVAPTGLSIQDLLNYTSDTRLQAVADETRQELLRLGLTAKEIEANLRTWGARLNQWNYRVTLDPWVKTELQQRLGGHLHTLVLAILGPERHYEDAVRGVDLIDTGIPHQGLLELLANPPKLCKLMMEGNPNSALVIVDGASGARHRAMNRSDVMLWFAAGEHIGREPVYLSVGLGQETVEAWRTDMRRQRRRAERLWQGLINHDFKKASQVYEHIVGEIYQAHEIQSALTESDKLNRFGRSHKRDQLLSEALNRIGSGLKLESLGFAEFLALGGIYLFVDATKEEIRAAVESFSSSIACVGGQVGHFDDDLISLFLPTDHRPIAAEFRQEKGIESSNKAMEDRATVALETRHQLAERIAKARSLNQRKIGFAKVPSTADSGFLECYQNAKQALGAGDRPVTEESFGTFLGHTRNALIALVKDLQHEEFPEERQGITSRLEQLFSGHRIDEQVYNIIAGGYEDIGDFGRLAQSIYESAQQGKIDTYAKQKSLRRIAQGAELFYIILAIDSTIEFTGQVFIEMDDMGLWRTLSGFFAKTLNDHSYEYRPWIYSRGTGFSEYRGEALYQLAVEHHGWLYRYLRFLIGNYTGIKEMKKPEQDMLLGNYLDGMEMEGIGAEADGNAEKMWRAYGQLREIAFIRNDGFPLPEVFSEFDPNLIRECTRVNHVIAAPVGRTHFSRALREGPTLARQLEKEGQRGGNLIITRKIDIHEKLEYPCPVALIRSGHLYLDADAYREALVAHKGYSQQDAATQAQRLHPKGIRVAARFTRPILAALVYPFHGDPVYDQGKLETCGLPYTVQSLFHTWTTYDKAKNCDIFRNSGVEMPDEIDWLTDFTARSPEKSIIKNWILYGLDDTTYPGLIDFAQRHPLVMIKDAAESGGRNAQAFMLGRADGSLDQEKMGQAVEFIYQISLKHHACIQEVILSSPEHWATEEFMHCFVHRQIVEWGSPVNRQRKPYTPIFGSHRIIVSTDNPDEPDQQKKWHFSHWITLNSKQLITNVGRGGTLEQLLAKYIRAEYCQAIIDKLTEAGRNVMEAMSSYETRSSAIYKNESGRDIGNDLMGISYGIPRYLMLDFLIVPVFEQEGRLAEVEPLFNEHGCRLGSRFILQKGSRRFEGTIKDWRVVLIEPNIGVGLWDRVALREEFHELEQAKMEDRAPNWDRIGENARIVLKDLNRAGEEYLIALKGKNAFLS
jgi:hypothetical protein